ncbi:Rieske (2Fe-2S) protein [Propioniciclava tarda]|uniref:Non-heme iron oxygenase ferredoxin subunit n=1 Tax=Propioniciclava tarda TaxID=433330 RepID=A0A4Q9KL95_PROTD|nr:non-heme iron oxygenase ferredoxin subunit [Propioniciclava tarda]TBT95286.1 non-heme iron oxygenase ferredoxin subunit [Propioniciclava tarda]SMO60233.1 3-phenylpropionate/trans-cinnamate dioxygenase ferredoxin subunit [Propioniciclava tarda]
MSFVRACSLADLKQDRPLGVHIGDVRVALVRSGDAIYAIHDECSHAKILLSVGDFDPEGPDGPTLECYGHGSRFDLQTGRPLELPATAPVPIYATAIEGDDVLVDLDNPIQES